MNRSDVKLGIVLVILLMAISATRAETNGRFTIKSVSLADNDNFSDARLQAVMISVPHHWYRRSYYYPEVLQDDLKNIELFYHENGYLDAKIIDHHVSLDSVNRKAHIAITVAEGELTTVESIGFFGNNLFSDEELAQIIDIKSGDPLQQSKLRSANIEILTRYANRGYLEAVIEPKSFIKPEINRVIIDFYITESHEFKIGNILPVGLEVTKPVIVFREITFHQGEIVDYSKLLESQRRLYLMGLFKSVNITAVSSAIGDSTQKDIEIRVVENSSGGVGVLAGFESVEKLRGRVEFYNNNLWGTARKFSLSARASFINNKFEVSFTDPYTFKTAWRSDLRAAIDYNDEPGYDMDRNHVNLIVGHGLEKRRMVTVGYRRERVVLKNIRVTEIPHIKTMDISGLKVSFLRDTRNNLFNATEGSYLEISNELTGGILGGTRSFVRIESKLKRFFLLKNETVIGSSIGIGFERPLDGATEIPLNERFYAGGLNTIRGFDYQKVGPLSDKRVPIGGQFSIVWNVAEIRTPIYKMIGGVLFLDSGNVWRSSKEFKITTMRVAAGTGLRVNTPIGLIRLDIGFNVDRKPREEFYKVHVGLGHVF